MWPTSISLQTNKLRFLSKNPLPEGSGGWQESLSEDQIKDKEPGAKDYKLKLQLPTAPAHCHF